MTNKEQVAEAAFQLGRLLADGGDFYDVAENFAQGWADAQAGRGDGGQDAAARHVLVQLTALDALQAAAREIIGWRVDDARIIGVPWESIGQSLDMTKQAAQQRFKQK